ncbi:serine hydrolase, partial [Steroidobacter sp.]|uniref:serine hydrolase n=1 Tax=Steroidobacter sp. TaxID=1978227 RepID=UPI0025FC6758
MRQWQTPGMAIAVINRGRVEYLGGLGVREQGSATPMDADTVFTVASLTKAFTAMAAAAAVDAGNIQWDEPVVKFLPGFRLRDPYVTAEASFRDLLSHRVGTFGDFQNGLALSRNQVIELLKFDQPRAKFRAGWVYSNILYAAAGEAVARSVGMSWDEHIRRTIFVPLGMTASSTTAEALANASNRASSHVRLRDGSVRVDPFRPQGAWSMDNHAPAGAINSNARDMSRWLQFQLGDGSVDGRRLVSVEQFEQTHAAQALYPTRENGRSSDDFQMSGYALGWEYGQFHGERVLSHNGLFRGHASEALLCPSRGVAVFVFANARQGAYGLTAGVAQWILAKYLELPDRDRAGEKYLAYKSGWEQKRVSERALWEPPSKRRAPSLALNAYAGTYTAADDWLTYVVTMQDNRLRLDLQQVAEPYFAWL